MILIPDAKKKSYGVFGLGVSGIATCEALVASGASVYSFDENAAAREKTAATEYRCEHPKNWPWNELAAVIVSPGVPLTNPKPHAIVRKARVENIPVLGDTELFARAMNALPPEERLRLVGVTGSNGKSTTTALIGHILKEAGECVHVGGNIGDAVLAMPAPTPDTIYVLELSSFQLDLTFSMKLDIAVFLNLTPDHIERHGTVDGYFAAKKRIFRNQTKDNAAVLAVDDDFGAALCTELTARGAPEVISVSSMATLGRGVYALEGDIFYNLDGKTTKAGSLENARALRGVHNQQNAAAALAVVTRHGVSPAVAVNAMERFKSLPHRLEEVERLGKVIFVNDSKATNADAAARALDAFDDIFWIVGGQPKDGGLTALLGRLDHVRCAYIIGEAQDEFAKQLDGNVIYKKCGDLRAALDEAYAGAQVCDAAEPVVLLSPACASYDQFKSFVERGDVFRSLVNQLRGANGEAA